MKMNSSSTCIPCCKHDQSSPMRISLTSIVGPTWVELNRLDSLPMVSHTRCKMEVVLHLFSQSRCRKYIHCIPIMRTRNLMSREARLDIVTLLDAVHRAGVSDLIPSIIAPSLPHHLAKRFHAYPSILFDSGTGSEPWLSCNESLRITFIMQRYRRTRTAVHIDINPISTETHVKVDRL
jgi:hypothetical protein